MRSLLYFFFNLVVKRYHRHEYHRNNFKRKLRFLRLKFQNWFSRQTCWSHDQWFLQTDGNEVVWWLGTAVRHRLVSIGTLYRVECPGTTNVQTLVTKNVLHGVLDHSAISKKSPKISFCLLFSQCKKRGENWREIRIYLKHWCGNDVLLQKCSWWKIVRETSRQMLQNGLNWMPRLLPSYSEILLQRPRKSGKYCLSSLIRFHGHLFFG